MKFAFRAQIACPDHVPSIRVLSETIANQIAAGEVIERPANVVKELLENSLDAGAKHIFIQFFNGGLPLIHVSDDGCGMDEDDAQLCFKRHATGKLAHIDDLQTLTSFGFRGEALPSIASVAEITLRTRRAENELGCEVKISTTASTPEPTLPSNVSSTTFPCAVNFSNPKPPKAHTLPIACVCMPWRIRKCTLNSNKTVA